MATNERELLFTRAAALDGIGEHSLAEQLLESALANSPDWPEGLLNLGVYYLRAGRIGQAEALIRQAQALRPGDPMISHNLGILLLGSGRYEEGLPLFEARLRVPGARPKPELPFPEWKGENLAGRQIVVWPEQGFGDQIQYARFLPMLRQAGADVTIVCEPALAALLANSMDISVVAASGAVELPNADFWVFGWSLPYRLGLSLETIPNAPYLASEAIPIAHETPRIGVATNGNPQHRNDRYRSMPPEAAASLAAALPTCISLAPSDTGARNFAETAKLIAELDLVISVDTAIAHLAGAMGKQVWIMLPWRGTDWRWMRDRNDTPWYPTARLFRQSNPQDWNSVISHIQQEWTLKFPGRSEPALRHQR